MKTLVVAQADNQQAVRLPLDSIVNRRRQPKKKAPQESILTALKRFTYVLLLGIRCISSSCSWGNESPEILTHCTAVEIKGTTRKGQTSKHLLLFATATCNTRHTRRPLYSTTECHSTPKAPPLSLTHIDHVHSRPAAHGPRRSRRHCSRP